MGFKKMVIRHNLLSLLVFILLLYSTLQSINVFAQTSLKIEPEQINKRVKLGNFVEVPIKITNDGNSQLSLRFGVEGNVAPFAALDKNSATIEPGLTEAIKLTVFGENLTTYTGFFVVSGTIEDKIPINVTVTD